MLCRPAPTRTSDALQRLLSLSIRRRDAQCRQIRSVGLYLREYNSGPSERQRSGGAATAAWGPLAEDARSAPPPVKQLQWNTRQRFLPCPDSLQVFEDEASPALPGIVGYASDVR